MNTRTFSSQVTANRVAVFIFLIFYIVMGLSYKLLNIKYSLKNSNYEKWSEFESKLRHIESELLMHHDMVGKVKSAFQQIPLMSQEISPSQMSKEPKETKLLEFSPPTLRIRMNVSSRSRPIQKKNVPKTDIQMLALYEKMTFDDETQDWNITYREDQWNKTNKLKVFIVPFSHNDPGWLMTFEKYYEKRTHAIFRNMVNKLTEGIRRKFIWSEISFLALWWDRDASNDEKSLFLSLVKNKTIEIVTGGWVMNDEASSHWLSTIQQLTLGHQWCMDNLDVAPKNAWSIDPFGYSSSQPYLLKLAGLDNSVIHRVHHRVKKELASNKQLEFRWRQLWDVNGKTEMFTHLFPFESYGVTHSCGPDPKTCCQFDFKRLVEDTFTGQCDIPPQSISEENIQERASLILDQWRKKAQLYRSNVLLFPLGDDFRYDRSNEWDNQFQNYDMLIDYINNNVTSNAKVQFGNLEDYFEALHAEVKMKDFPVLSGDFFTYADSKQYYWSGYFTSRPFYKHMDRVLLAYVRAAETLKSQVASSRTIPSTILLQLCDQVNQAKKTLSLFQHHDAITGTSRDLVIKDYARKMHTAIKYCQSVIQQAGYYLLKQPPIVQQTEALINLDENWQGPYEIPSRITITLDVDTPSRKIILYNALPFTRHEVLTMYVFSPYVEIFDSVGNPLKFQISPAVICEQRFTFQDSMYQISYPVVVKSLALLTYTLALSNNTISEYASYSKVRMYNAKHWTTDLPKIFPLEKPSSRLWEDITIQSGNSTKVVISRNGLIKAIISSNDTVVPVHMEFVQYGSQEDTATKSGAYLFMPSGPAEPFYTAPFREIIVTEGLYKATLYTVLTSEAADVALAISIYNNPSLQQSEVEIINTLLIKPQVRDFELAMRFSTDIKNGDLFYTDVNGMQMIKRRYLKKLPIQGNYYPLSAAAYIEDDDFRLTLLTSTPLGFGALKSGQFEVMQDRRLLNDDLRGLGQGVLDNVKTRHIFKLILENAIKPCPVKAPAEHPSGQLTLGAHVSQQFLLQPVTIMHYMSREDTLRSEYSRTTLNAADLVLATYQSSVTTKNKDGSILRGTGVTLQRVHLEQCYGDKEINKWYQLSDGQVHLSDLVDAPTDGVYESTLTFINLKNPLHNNTVTLCPQEVKSVFIKNNLKA